MFEIGEKFVEKPRMDVRKQLPLRELFQKLDQSVGRFMRQIGTILCWSVGVLLVLVGAVICWGYPFMGAVLVALALMLLPPVRAFFYRCTRIELSFRTKAVVVVSLALAAGYIPFYEGQKDDIRYFRENSSEILGDVKRLLDAGQYSNVVIFYEKYLPTGDEDLLQLYEQAQMAIKEVKSAVNRRGDSGTGSGTGSELKEEKAQRREETDQDRRVAQFGKPPMRLWGGSFKAVDEYLKREYYGFAGVDRCEGEVYYHSTDGWLVRCEYILLPTSMARPVTNAEIRKYGYLEALRQRAKVTPYTKHWKWFIIRGGHVVKEADPLIYPQQRVEEHTP